MSPLSDKKQPIIAKHWVTYAGDMATAVYSGDPDLTEELESAIEELTSIMGSKGYDFLSRDKSVVRFRKRPPSAKPKR